MKTKRSRGKNPPLLNLGTRWKCVISFTPLPLYPQRSKVWYPFDMMQGRPQSLSERWLEVKTLFVLGQQQKYVQFLTHYQHMNLYFCVRRLANFQNIMFRIEYLLHVNMMVMFMLVIVLCKEYILISKFLLRFIREAWIQSLTQI
jgi:hypothetical protein